MSEIILPVLRDYQQDLLNKIRSEMSAGNRRVLAVAPTGAGKGALITYIVGQAVQRGNRAAFLVNRRELVRDMSKRLDRLGIEHGILMGAQTRGAWLPVQIASIDTLHRRKLPKASLVIADEAHFAVSKTWLSVIDRYMGDGARLLMTTATPVRLDGRGLRAIADVLVEGPTVDSLTKRGYLVPARVFAPSIPDLTGVHSSAGDFNQSELAGMMDNTRLIGDVVANWLAVGSGRPTVAFCVNRVHSEHLVDKFRAAGVTSAHVDANTPDAERDRTWRDLANGRIQVVSSVGIISYGWDVPPVSCAILARPTQSLALHLQQCGRVLRPCEGKRDAIILDHAGNTLRHGFVDDERQWTLEDREKKSRSEREELPDDKLPRVCPRCQIVSKPTARQCPCGYQFSFIQRAQPVEVDGTLSEILDKRTYTLSQYAEAAGDDADDIGVKRIIEKASSRGWKPGAVYMQKQVLFEARNKYRSLFGSDPKPHWTVAALNSIVEIEGRKRASA